MRSDFLPAELAGHTVESLYAMHGPQRPWTYWLVLAGVIGALVSLPLIKVDISVRALGMVRPATGRAELRPAVAAQISRVLVKDNDQVKAGQPLLILSSGDLDERRARNQALQAERSALIADLTQITTQVGGGRSSGAIDFQTPALRQELAQYLAQLDSYRLAETKVRNELARYTILAGKGIATQQELDNARYEAERLQAETRLLKEQTLSRWQSRLREERTAFAGLVSDEQRLDEEMRHYSVRAPADGVLIGFTGWSAGGFVAAGQALGAVSPDDMLLVETQVSPRDIGLVRVGQAARLQIDAYPYTQWGTLEGVVTAIGGDLADGSSATRSVPSFKVTIRASADHLTLPNGVRGELKKGLTLSARFLVARRSVFQLLYDDVSAWLNPQGQRPAT